MRGNEGMVYCGIDNVEQYDDFLKGKRLALITNPTGVNRDLKSSIDVLNELYDVTLLFSPEHGVRGDKQAGEHVESYVDEKTGIEVFSLYGSTRDIPPHLNERYDVLIYDIQDTGSRFYTYISTLLNCLKSCGMNQKLFMILDRPNPIGGHIVEGNRLEPELLSFVGCYPMPQRYGLTPGEFAMMANEMLEIGCDLVVAKLSGYQRNMLFNEMNLTFINPSPNIPTLESELLYNGTCYFEGTSLSEGRGTTKPFEIIGAPWIDAEQLAKVMNEKQLPGVKFRATHFTPTFSKHQGVLCQGVQIHIIDEKIVRSVELGLELLKETQKMTVEEDFFISPPFEQDQAFFDKLCGTKAIRLGELEIDSFIKQCEKDSRAFEQQKMKYHLYD